MPRNTEQSTTHHHAKTNAHYDLIIIGAGIAGLAAGRLARDAGKLVLILDKGRRVGGRVATRRANGFVFNHGAQFLTARDPDFTALCDSAIANGDLVKWQPGDRTALIGSPFMRAFPMFLADGLSIRQECEITNITSDGSTITVATKDDVIATANSAIISAPAPQAAKLVGTIAPELVATAESATYAPCWTALFGFEGAPTPIPDLIHNAAQDRNGIIGWAGWEHQRPTTTADTPHNRVGYALTIQASPEWSSAHIEQEQPDNLAALKSAYEALTGSDLGTPAYAAAHRWLYAKVSIAAPVDMPRLSHCGRIAIAGDWLGGARIEHAYLSGRAAAASLLG